MSENTDQVEATGFARVVGSPGAHPRMIGIVRSAWPLLVGLFVAGCLVGASWPRPALSPGEAGMGLLVLCAGLALVALWSEHRFARYLKGARGEEYVAARLARLPGEYGVFHGVSIGMQQDIDHIVVGPGGIFLIETKNWRGVISLDSDRILVNQTAPSRSPLKQIKKAVDALTAELRASGVEAPVFSAICFVMDNVQGGARHVGEVWMGGPDELIALITGQPQVLDREVRRRAAAVLAGLMRR